MGVALLAWGRFFGPHGERVTVPAPVDGRGAPWLLDFLAIATSYQRCRPVAPFSIDVTCLAPQIV